MADKRRRFVYVTDGHAVDGKVPAGEVPESWRCVDCGVDTAPGIVNRVELERALAAGNGHLVERQFAVDVPKFRYVDKEQFEENWHLASWVPNDPDGPTVLMNKDAP